MTDQIKGWLALSQYAQTHNLGWAEFKRLVEAVVTPPAAPASALMPNGEPWDQNPDGIRLGEESGPRMDRHTGMWDVPNDEEDALADAAVAEGRTPGDSVPGVSTAALVRAKARATQAPAAVAQLIADIRAARSMARRDQLFEELIEVLEAPMPATQAPAAVDQMRAHVESFASSLGWKAESGEGAFEFVQRASYRQGWQDGRREALGDAHRDLPEVLKDLDHICAHGDPGSQETAHDARDKLRALSAPMPATQAPRDFTSTHTTALQPRSGIEVCTACGRGPISAKKHPCDQGDDHATR